jgi:hypothetical protein
MEKTPPQQHQNDAVDAVDDNDSKADHQRNRSPSNVVKTNDRNAARDDDDDDEYDDDTCSGANGFISRNGIRKGRGGVLTSTISTTSGRTTVASYDDDLTYSTTSSFASEVRSLLPNLNSIGSSYSSSSRINNSNNSGLLLIGNSCGNPNHQYGSTLQSLTSTKDVVMEDEQQQLLLLSHHHQQEQEQHVHYLPHRSRYHPQQRTNVYRPRSMVNRLLERYFPRTTMATTTIHRRYSGQNPQSQRQQHCTTNDHDSNGTTLTNNNNNPMVGSASSSLSTTTTSSSSFQQLSVSSICKCIVTPRVLLTVAICVVIGGNLIIGSHFLQSTWYEIGSIAGIHAQHIANRAQLKLVAVLESRPITTPSSSNHPSQNNRALSQKVSKAPKDTKTTKAKKDKKIGKKDLLQLDEEDMMAIVPLTPLRMSTTPASTSSTASTSPIRSSSTMKNPNIPSTGCEGTIMLLRHCEKGNLKSHCNYSGYERSVYLASLFGDKKAERWPKPSDIYALNRARISKKKKHLKKVNLREVETVQTLASKHNIAINQEYTVDTTDELAEHLLRKVVDGDICGKLVVVSWKHSDIPRLAQYLGCGPLEGCPISYHGKDFDSVWMIRYVFATFHSQTPTATTATTQKSITTTMEDSGSSVTKWMVFGSVQQQNFDPLAFSKSVGDYPPGGKTISGTIATWSNETSQTVFFG